MDRSSPNIVRMLTGLAANLSFDNRKKKKLELSVTDLSLSFSAPSRWRCSLAFARLGS